MMRRFYFWIVALLLSGPILFAQNPPSIGTPDNDTLFLKTGQNFLLIPEVDDNEPGVDQTFSFTVTSSDTNVLKINDISYLTGNTFAIVHVTEKGKKGSVTIDVEATDPDGTATASFEVYVRPYDLPGIKFEIHDIVFWQRFVPLDANPAFSMIAESGLAPYAEIDLPALQLSVYSDCMTSPPCTGVDFFTALFKGYVIPPATGEYTFYMSSGDQKSIGLSTDERFDNVSVILHSYDGIGTTSGDKEWMSAPQSLDSGKVYAIYGTHWNVHTLMGGILWEGPGISKQYIQGEHMTYVYDIVKPAAPGNLLLVNTGLNDLRLSWETATDDQKLAGYNVYVNGRLVNNEIIKGIQYQVTGLSPGTKYSAIVTSLDLVGNESAESNIISTTTYLSDDVPPSPPSTVEAPVISDLGLKLSWSGASDGETEIRGYRIYVNGTLYNTDEYIYGEEATVLGLSPQTTYQIELEAVDAGYNVSAKSTVFEVLTKAFDPTDTSITDKKARVNVRMETIGRNDGLAVNPDYVSGEFLDDAEQVKLIQELEVAGIRWGALTANPLNFADFIGTGKTMTFGRFMDFCNGIDAYSIITCGVENSTDWMTDTETFTNFLEYIAGPADSEYGSIRAGEGYTESLLAGSPGLVFEFGNEVWGGNAHDAQIGSDYAQYGQWCREMARLMKSSEYYDSDKIFLVYSGRNPHPSDSYGLNDRLMRGDTGEVDWLAVSGYLGGNLDYSPEIDPGESELDYYMNGFASVKRNLEGLVETMKETIAASGDLKPTYFYESNMTNSYYYGRVGQAILQTGYYAAAIETGSAIPALFHLTGGQWKMVIPAQNYTKTPLFYATKYFNRYCKGNILKTTLETAASGQSGGSLIEFGPVGCHAYTQDGTYSLLFFSREFENDFMVQVDLPDELQYTSPEKAKKYIISGDHYSDKETAIDSSVITISDSLLMRVPKYSMVVIAFEGEDQQFESLPLGHYEYIPATSVRIYAYNSDEFDIVRRAKKIFLVEVEPDSAFSDGVKWEMDTNSVSVLYSLESYGFLVQGSGTCDGNGTVTLKAMAWDNPDVFDQITINISGQGDNCGTGLTEHSYSQLKIYPNPVDDHLYMKDLPAIKNRIMITDLLGRQHFTQLCHEPAIELNVSRLPAGIYILNIIGPDGILIRRFIKN